MKFQKAKLKFEANLANQDSMTYTIVRPTAFFKSVSGQLKVIQQGTPFVMFGDRKVTQCNSIAEADLAQYLMDSVVDKLRLNKNIDLGGPDEPLTMLKQGEVSFDYFWEWPSFFWVWNASCFNCTHTLAVIGFLCFTPPHLFRTFQMLFKAVGKEPNYFFAPFGCLM